MKLIEQFERCTLPKEEWTHERHFIMAFWYCVNFPLPQAVQKIREGIKTYNVSVGGENTDVSGYHETITLFFTRAVAEYVMTAGISAVTEETIAGLVLQSFLKKDYIYRFYSEEVLMSKEARREWKEGDKRSR